MSYFRFGLVNATRINRNTALKTTLSPEAAFKSDSHPLRFIEPDVLANAFLHCESRKVDKSGCINFMSKKYEVGLNFIGCTVDVVYDPVREESILDSARRPMLIVAVFALLLAIMTMQIIMGWVLSLVENVKTAADSIDAGQLDVHLPEEGEHEIAELAHSINQLIDRLRRRAEVQTRFVADASHELATPVAGIRGYVNILRDWGAEDPVMREEAISAIDRESRRMARLCADLLSMVRSEEVLEFKACATTSTRSVVRCWQGLRPVTSTRIWSSSVRRRDRCGCTATRTVWRRLSPFWSTTRASTHPLKDGSRSPRGDIVIV